MARVFISYAHEEHAAAKQVVDALAREGVDSWWDHDIPPGRSWDEVIGQRIGAADIVIVIWSSSSICSNFVKEEAQLAFDAGKLLPVKVEEITPPIGFRRIHAANLVGWHGEANHRQWRALLAEIAERLGPATKSAPGTAAFSAAPPPAQSSQLKPFPTAKLWQAAIATAMVIGLGILLFKSGPQTARTAASDQAAPTAAASTATTDKPTLVQSSPPPATVAVQPDPTATSPVAIAPARGPRVDGIYFRPGNGGNDRVMIFTPGGKVSVTNVSPSKTMDEAVAKARANLQYLGNYKVDAQGRLIITVIDRFKDELVMSVQWVNGQMHVLDLRYRGQEQTDAKVEKYSFHKNDS